MCPNSSTGITLRPYQVEAIQQLRISIHQGNKRILGISPTGSGKTELAMDVIGKAKARGRRVVFLCNRIHLVEQASRRFRRSGIEHGVIQGDNTSRTYEQVLVCSIQTVAKRGMPEADLIVIDEAHCVPGSKDIVKILTDHPTTPVLGLTATPWAKGMAKHIDSLAGALFQDSVVATTVPKLIEQGFLVDVDVYAPSTPDMSGIRQKRNAFGELDYSDADIGRAVDKPELVGDIVAHWMRLAKDTPTVCFASNIAHSKHIVERFIDAGVMAEHIDCYTSDDDRRAILERVTSGVTKVISNVGILAEGWDFPACRTLILARPTKSMIRYVQMAGRILRPHPGKERALILDHSGTVVNLGFPTEEFDMTLDDGTPRKSATSDRKQEEKLPKACPTCSFLKTVAKCPCCGTVTARPNEVEHADGELVALDRKKVKHTMMDKQATYSGLLQIAQEKGYSPGWVANQYRAKFGVWPRTLVEVAAEPSPELRSWVKSQQIRYAKSKPRFAEVRHAA